MVNMSASWKIASMVVLPLSLALAGTGCVAQSDEPADDQAASVDEGADQAVAENAQAQVGEAQEACGGFFGGFGGFGGWGGCGAWNRGFFGGYPFGGFGGYGGYCSPFRVSNFFGGGCW
jgi:hypothetical protein